MDCIDNSGVSYDVEVLTPCGWNKICNLDSHSVILQYDFNTEIAKFKEIKNFIKYPCKKLYVFDSKVMSFCLDFNHTLCYWNRNSNNPDTDIFGNIINKHHKLKGGFDGKFPMSFKYSGVGIDLTDIEIKIMCAVICDGCFDKENNRSNRCRVRVKKKRKVDEMRKLLDESGLKYRVLRENDYVMFYFSSPRMEKEFGEYWYNCNQHQLQVICDNILFWDGHIDFTVNNYERRVFYSTVKDTADFIQFAFMATGNRASIRNDTRTRFRTNVNGECYSKTETCYVVNISNHSVASMFSGKGKRDIETYENTYGYKYCISSDDFVVYRRNGRIFIAKGN